MNKYIIILLCIVLTACGMQQNMGEVATNEASYAQVNQVISTEQYSLGLTQLEMDGNIYQNEAHRIELQLNIAEQTYTGMAACNRFFGTLQLIGEDAVRFNDGGSTEMVCDAAAMQWQARIFNALHGHTFYINQNADNVVLKQVDGNIILAFNTLEQIQE